MSELTNANSFELLTAEHKDRGDVTDNVSIDRWTNYGKDRLYLNGLRTGDGWISLKTDESGGDRWTKVSADYELDGDTLTITVGNKTTIYTITVRVHGDGFESAADEETDANSDDEPSTDADNSHPIVADGGEDVTSHIDDETIEDAIEQHDDPSHPDAATVEEVRKLLVWLQQDAEDWWSEMMDNIERGGSDIITETDNVLVISTGKHDAVRERLADYEVVTDTDLDGTTVDVVSGVIHDVARQLTDYDWGVAYPFVVQKSSGVEDGQQFVEAIINSLLRRGLSPGQAWAYYGVKIRGHSRNQWATRCGYSDHSAVSEPLRKAEQKLS